MLQNFVLLLWFLRLPSIISQFPKAFCELSEWLIITLHQNVSQEELKLGMGDSALLFSCSLPFHYYQCVLPLRSPYGHYFFKKSVHFVTINVVDNIMVHNRTCEKVCCDISQYTLNQQKSEHCLPLGRELPLLNTAQD